MRINSGQKRFLIAWIIFHSFALFVSLAKINGKIYEDGSNTKERHYVYLLAYDDNSNDFWPFTSYSHKSLGTVGESITYANDEKINFPGVPDAYYYGGIFNSYDFTEYVFYTLLGLGVVFLPKIWKR